MLHYCQVRHKRNAAATPQWLNDLYVLEKVFVNLMLGCKKTKANKELFASHTVFERCLEELEYSCRVALTILNGYCKK